MVQGKFGNYFELDIKDDKPRSSLKVQRKLCLEPVVVV